MYVPPPHLDAEPALTVWLEAFPSDVRGLRLERVVVVLDGAPLYVRSGQMPNAPRVLAATDAAPGDHTLQMLLVASAPCGLLDSPRWTLQLRSARSFTVGERAVRLRIVPTIGDATAPPDELLGIRVVESRGARAAPGAPSRTWIEPAERLHDAAFAGCPPLDALAGPAEQ